MTRPHTGTLFHIGRVSSLAFLALFAYGFARSSIESVFIAEHGTTALPTAWLLVAASTTVVVFGYQRLLAKRDLGWIFTFAAVASAAALALLVLARQMHVPYAVYALYVWKDVHVVVLLELLWSSANVVFQTSTAKWTYGFFCVCGSLGDLTSNLLVGKFSQAFGTDQAVWVPVGVLLTAAVVNALFARLGPMPTPPAKDAARVGLMDSLRSFRRSDYLPWLLVMILLVQTVITLVDYAYNGVLEAAYPDKDHRTAVIGDVYAVIAVAALVLQLGTPAILRWVGVTKTLLSVPAIIAMSLGAFLVMPVFAVMMLTKVASKAFDYSVFRAAKEMLYIPLRYDEKTQGKGFIDMLAYRVAKGGVSLVLAALVTERLAKATPAIAIAVAALWLGVSIVVTKRYARRMAGVAET